MASEESSETKSSGSTMIFEGRFDPNEYLHKFYGGDLSTPIGQRRFIRLKLVHEFFDKILPDSEESCSSKDFKVLDYGAGPVIAFAISAAGKHAVSEIVIAEYTELSRIAVQNWCSKEANLFDWSPYFKYVVQDLEKKPEDEVRVREERLRSLIKVASCDIKADQPIEKGFEGPYDVVMTFLALESACENEAEYFSRVQRFSRLIKPGGYSYLLAKVARTAQPILYNVGGKEFCYYALTEDVFVSALEKAGLQKIQSMHMTAKLLSEVSPDANFAPSDDEEIFYLLITAKKTAKN